jgi:trimeric autotransporter adhesin
MALGSILTLAAFSSTPSPPPGGFLELYVQGTTIYLQDSSGNVYAFGSTTAIAQLTGDVSAIGPGSAVATVNFVGGQSAANVASATTAYLNATSASTAGTLVIRDSSGNFAANVITASLNGNATSATSAGSAINFTGSLVGDVTGTQGATVVSFVGGSTAANVHLAELAANAATSVNTASTIVKRDASGNFAANIITAALSGNATSANSAINFTGSLAGDVTGTQSATVVAFVGGSSAANVHSAELAANAATSMNSPGDIVARDGSGNFSAGTITANLIGNVSGSAGSFTGSLVGDVTGTQGATVVAFVGGSSAANVHSAELAANAATNLNTASTIVKRNASGNFSAGTITANLIGTATNITGLLAIVNGGTNSAAALANNRVMQSSGGAIVEAAAITPNQALISDSNGIPTQSVTTATELSYVHGVTSSIQTQLNSVSGSAITQLTGDVTAVGPGIVAATIAAIQGKTVSGTTGTTNVVFSNAPTLTGLLSAASAVFSSTISASNLSGTNTGDVTAINSNSIDLGFSSGQNNLQANLNISAASPDAGYIPVVAEIKTDGLLVEVLAGTPVQIGTSNNIGSAVSAARSDHVHAITSSVILGLLLTGYTTGSNTPITATNSILTAFENLQAQISATTGAAITSLTGDVTATGPGAAAATVVAIQGKSISSTAPTDAQLLLWVSGTSKWTPASISGDILITDTGAATIQPNVVGNSKLAQAPTLTLKGNNTGSTANVTDLTVAQVNTMLGTVTTVGTYNGGTANANGATITPNSIFFQSASTSFPGMVDTTTQSFAGNKTFTGNVVVQSLEANGTGGNGFIQIDTQSATPSNPPAGDLKLYTNTSNGFNRTRELDSTGASFALDRDLYEIVYNNSGSTISKGQLVYINGVYTGGSPNVPTIALAKANSPTTAPAFGMCYDTIANNSFGRVFTAGNISGFDTSAFTNGQAVYLSSTVAGGLTATEPLAPNISQIIGYVTNAAVSGSVDMSIRAGLNTSSGTYRSSFQIGPNSGSSAVSLAFANAFIAMLQWNPTAAFALLLPPTLPTAGQYLGAADGAGTLQWTNPLVNIDGGSAPSIYTPAQLINGGTP